MNSKKTEGKWNELKGKLKQKLATATDNDLKYEERKRDGLLSKLRINLDKTKKEIHKLFHCLVLIIFFLGIRVPILISPYIFN